MSAPRQPAAIKVTGYLVLGAVVAHRIAQAAARTVEPLGDLIEDLDEIIRTYTEENRP